MRVLMAILLLLALFSDGLAEEDKVQPPAQGQVESAESEMPPAVWPSPFQPSEEIGADSHISFPTDI